MYFSCFDYALIDNFVDCFLQIGIMTLAIIIVALYVLPLISAQRYDGCYGMLSVDARLLLEDRNDLTNEYCARICGSNGYTFSITHVSYCYCSQLSPFENLTNPLDLNNAGRGKNWYCKLD